MVWSWLEILIKSFLWNFLQTTTHRISHHLRLQSPVGKSQSEKLQAGRLEENISVLGWQLKNPWNSVAEVPDDIDGAGEKIVELSYLHRLVLHQTGLGLQLLLADFNELKHFIQWVS